ncbi:hypothetical protein TIFTF001_044085 [Ficus carica]|uniref:Uncharacterized protein n=1 Tax=Ficus carica TaxID=3494 RepID=A0AA87Z787_FICCA|nr:hypothetical protein TIFTF001_044085 [Ficus carica]
MTIGEPAMPGGTWVDFRALITVRYGLPPDEDDNMPYRDPEIYNDMKPVATGIVLLREGLLPSVRPFVPEPVVGMTLKGMIEAIMEVEIIVHGMQAAAPEEDQVVPVYDAGIAEAGAEDDVMDPADIPADPEDHPEDPPVIIIESDDEEEDEEDQEHSTTGTGVRQGVPRNLKVPLVPDGIQANPPLVREDLLFERFRRMKAPEFEGTTNPIEADNWLIDIQVILDFMGITEREKVLCVSFALKKDARH